jgi:hypothetical protein
MHSLMGCAALHVFLTRVGEYAVDAEFLYVLLLSLGLEQTL